MVFFQSLTNSDPEDLRSSLTEPEESQKEEILGMQSLCTELLSLGVAWRNRTGEQGKGRQSPLQAYTGQMIFWSLLSDDLLQK